MTAELKRYRMWIDGEWVDARNGRVFPTVSPFTGKPWAEIPDGQAEDVDGAVRAARAAFERPAWRRMAPIERGKCLRRLGDLLAEQASELAAIETRDNGKLIREMSGQLQAIPNWYYGRDNGIDAIREYTQVKNVWVELSGATADPFKIR